MIRIGFVNRIVGHITGTFQWEHQLDYGLDAFFIGRLARTEDEYQIPVLASSVWIQQTYAPPYLGKLRLPAGYRTSAVYSRKAFRNVMLYVETPFLNPPTLGNYTQLYVGLENGASGSDLLSYVFTPGPRLYVFAIHKPHIFNIDVTGIYPPDGNRHAFKIWHGRYFTAFIIDNKPVAFAVKTGLGELISSSAPYAVVSLPNLPEALTTILELHTDRTDNTDVEIDVPSPFWFRILEGYEVHTMNLPLHPQNSSTPLAGSAISTNTTSHPFPMVPGRTRLIWRSSGSGTLTLQVFGRGFATAGSVSYSAGVEYYIELPPATLGRVIVNPSASQTIHRAEVVIV